MHREKSYLIAEMKKLKFVRNAQFTLLNIIMNCAFFALNTVVRYRYRIWGMGVSGGEVDR